MFKLLLVSVMLIAVQFTWAQNLTAEEQRQMLQDMQAMKQKINQLEAKQGASSASPAASGLKKVNYADETAEKKDNGAPPATDGGLGAAAGASLSAEQQKKLLDDINVLKAKQEESRKVLEELEKEEEERYK